MYNFPSLFCQVSSTFGRSSHGFERVIVGTLVCWHVCILACWHVDTVHWPRESLASIHLSIHFYILGFINYGD